MSRLIDIDDPRNCYIGMDGEYETYNIDPDVIAEVSSVQPERTEERTETHACDCVSRQAAIDAIDAACMKYDISPYFDDKRTDEEKRIDWWEMDKVLVKALICDLPFIQPEPLSDAYMKAVWTWLLDYQIKTAELKGRYTPYEVLSWVANDWRKEHE